MIMLSPLQIQEARTKLGSLDAKPSSKSSWDNISFSNSTPAITEQSSFNISNVLDHLRSTFNPQKTLDASPTDQSAIIPAKVEKVDLKYTYGDSKPMPDKVNVLDNIPKKAIVPVTFYHPMNSRETKPNPDGIGSIGQKVQFGDVAFGSRDIMDKAKELAKSNEYIYVYFDALKDVKTPYGYGKFKVMDSKNKRYGNYSVDFVSDNLYGTKPYAETNFEKKIGNGKLDAHFIIPKIK